MDLYQIYKEGNYKGINILLKRGHERSIKGFYGACEGGNKTIILELINKSGDMKKEHYNNALYYLYLGKHIELADILQNLYPNKFCNLEYTLMGACSEGSLDLVYLSIQILNDKNIKIDWNKNFAAACLGGHMNIVAFIIAKGANNWNWGLLSACRGGSLDIVEIMISLGANNWNEGLYAVSLGGLYDSYKNIRNIKKRFEIISKLISLGANDWNKGLEGACYRGAHHLINFFINKGATNLSSILIYLCSQDWCHLIKRYKKYYNYDNDVINKKIINEHVKCLLTLPVNYDLEILIKK